MNNCSSEQVGRIKAMFPKDKGNRLYKLFRELEWDGMWLTRVRTWTIPK